MIAYYIKTCLKKVFPKHTAGGRLVRLMLSRLLNFGWIRKTRIRREADKYDKGVKALLDPGTLNDKIAFVRAMADSDASGKKYCIIEWSYSASTSAGLCAIISVHFCGVAYALSTGKIPVIDMQNHPSIYLEKEKLGKENAWEYYFEQPFNCGLESVRMQKAERMGPVFDSRCLPRALSGNEPGFDKYFQTWKTIYGSCFRLNDATRKHVDEEYKKLFKTGMRVLGVNCRGADYNPVMARNHPVQPDIDTLVAKVRASMAAWECDCIFIATPEKKNVDIFNAVFPGKVLCSSAAYYDGGNIDFTKQYLGTVKHDRPDDAYLNGLEYLTSVVLLSRCTSAVLSRTAGSTVARYINGGRYENVYVFDLGIY